MDVVRHRWPAALALVAAVAGFLLAGASALDYTKHLDRQVHDIHCSFVPGAAAAKEGADAGCRAAMYSPYAALLRDRYWGGIPIALFAVGAFAFFAAYALYLVSAGTRAPRRAPSFFAATSFAPLAASAVMAFIAYTRIGQFCMTCVGMYASSVVLAIAGVATVLVDRRAERPFSGAVSPTLNDDDPQPPPPRRQGGFLLVPTWLLALAAFTATPALVYAQNLPNYASHIAACGKLEKPADAGAAALKVSLPSATQPATMFVDPLCATCKAFHQRLVAENVLEQLDLTVVLFPLDSECNWMLDRPFHPGACIVSRAVTCGGARSMQVLEWAYETQDALLAAGKADPSGAQVKAKIAERFPDLGSCVDAKETKLRQDKMLRYIVANQLPVSTPQFFLGDTKLCNEDSDIGLSYTLGRLAPNLKPRP